MDANELLLNLRQIVREEMTLGVEQLTQQMNSHFDRLETLFNDLLARLHRSESEVVSLRGDFERVGTMKVADLNARHQQCA